MIHSQLHAQLHPCPRRRRLPDECGRRPLRRALRHVSARGTAQHPRAMAIHPMQVHDSPGCHSCKSTCLQRRFRLSNRFCLLNAPAVTGAAPAYRLQPPAQDCLLPERVPPPLLLLDIFPRLFLHSTHHQPRRRHVRQLQVRG